jgi:hypothetical protein
MLTLNIILISSKLWLSSEILDKLEKTSQGQNSLAYFN